MSGHRHRADVIRARGRGIAWAVPFLLLLAVLIVAALAFTLANLDTGPEGRPEVAPPSPRSGPAVARVPAIVLALLGISLMALVIAAIVALLLRGRKGGGRAVRRSWWDLLAPVFALGILAIVLLLGQRAEPIASESDGSNATAGTGGSDTVWPASAILPFELFLLAAVFAAIVWIAYRFRKASGPVGFRRVDVLNGPSARRFASATIQETIDALEFGQDVRATIIECFHRFCRLLGARGVQDQEPLTPRELEALAVERLGVSGDAPEALTSLFEEARYSHHRLGEAERGRAIESLSRIRAALEG